MTYNPSVVSFGVWSGSEKCDHLQRKIIITRTASSYEQGPSPTATRTPRTAEPTEVGPKGCLARGKSEDAGQRLSRGIRCNGKCTGSAKGWMCAYLDLFDKPRPHWPVRTTFKIWPQDWPNIIPTKFHKNPCSRSRDINFPYFKCPLVAKIQIRLIPSQCHRNQGSQIWC